MAQQIERRVSNLEEAQKNLVTKDDLKTALAELKAEMATKADLAEMATKADVRAQADRVIEAIQRGPSANF